jgi:hypothetical protein
LGKIIECCKKLEPTKENVIKASFAQGCANAVPNDKDALRTIENIINNYQDSFDDFSYHLDPKAENNWDF